MAGAPILRASALCEARRPAIGIANMIATPGCGIPAQHVLAWRLQEQAWAESPRFPLSLAPIYLDACPRRLLLVVFA
jgi:hypothetical protein